MQLEVFGHSAKGNPIFSYRFGIEGPHVLILGGVHGDEDEGVTVAMKLLEIFQEAFPYRLRLTLVPIFNPDGVLKKQRTNGNGVDLNRNLPTSDWSPEVKTPRYHPGPSANSELENHALVKFINQEKPNFIISLHSYKPMLNVNGKCMDEARAISQVTGYIIEESIGYPTPGCLGTYTGIERDIPTITYEIERGSDFETILGLHPRAIVEALKVIEQKR